MVLGPAATRRGGDLRSGGARVVGCSSSPPVKTTRATIPRTTATAPAARAMRAPGWFHQPPGGGSYSGSYSNPIVPWPLDHPPPPGGGGGMICVGSDGPGVPGRSPARTLAGGHPGRLRRPGYGSRANASRTGRRPSRGRLGRRRHLGHEQQAADPLDEPVRHGLVRRRDRSAGPPSPVTVPGDRQRLAAPCRHLTLGSSAATVESSARRRRRRRTAGRVSDR